MDLVAVFFLGFLALPFYWMGALVGLFIINVVQTESEAFGWATFSLLGGVGLVAWLGGNVNVFSWTWNNLTDVLRFLAVYFAVGGLWSVAKWYLHLLKIRGQLERDIERQRAADMRSGGRPPSRAIRPLNTFARNSKGRILGWIAYWPFSMIGSLFGDALRYVVEGVFNLLKGLYDRIGSHVFAGYSNY